jgi:glycine/sarcosine N-methyltransferase
MSLYDAIAGFYDELFPLKESRLAFIDSFLKQKPQTVLDIGCASGELVLALAKKGHYPVGIDLDGQMIELAAAKAKKQGLKANFLKKNMTRIGEDFPPGSFAAVLCFGNTLAHLESPETMKYVFRGVYQILKADGMVAVQVVNYDRILSQGIKALPLLESEHFIFRREYHYYEGEHRIDFITHLTEKRSGQVTEGKERLYLLRFAELKQILEDTGFSGIHYFGGESKEPYGPTSPALVAVAYK